MDAPEPQTAEQRDAEARAQAAATGLATGALLACVVLFIIARVLM